MSIQAQISGLDFFFKSGRTRSESFRMSQLSKLYRLILRFEPEIMRALKNDLGRPYLESYETEVHFVKNELKHCMRNLHSWMKPQKLKLPIHQIPGRAWIQPEPLGKVLIFAPYNYPYQLSLCPTIGAIAAGNVVALKPSEQTPYTSKLIGEMITDNFDSDFLCVFEGGESIANELLEHKFEHVFFTGSNQVGKKVLMKASESLTPVTLELGGKNPCIVDQNADLKIAARRICWGKFINAGQTCVAPDYLLVHEKVKSRFINQLQVEINQFYGQQIQKTPDYGRIINTHHFDRLISYLNSGDIVCGGEADRDQLFIAPSLLTQVSLDSPVMQEEIFGPILPIFSYCSNREAQEIIERNPNPLALYIFSQDKSIQNFFTQNISFGGGCINETLAHLSINDLPFGGVGQSGMGSYHGKKSFETFSHCKGILKKSTQIDSKIRYAPYDGKFKSLKRLLDFSNS